MAIKLKRVYEPADPGDGFRILVDRLWPRGLSNEKARVDLWMRDIAPSTELRKWFGHEPAKWEGFGDRYREELRSHEDLLAELLELERREGTLTLLFGARDEVHNEAQVIEQVLLERRS